MPDRKVTSNIYRYGFNGKENDGTSSSASSTGDGTQDYGMRIYNPSLGRFLSVDPLEECFVFWSPYQYAGNSPVTFSDMDGAEVARPTLAGFGLTTAYTADGVTKAIKEHPNSSTLKLFAVALKNVMAAVGVDIVSLTDINDAVILGTTITRGSLAIDVKGNLTTPTDRAMAQVGAIVPLVSGSFVAKIVKGFEKLGVDNIATFLKAGKYRNWTDFYDKTRHLNVNDRIAEYRKAGSKVAESMGWAKDSKLSKKFKRDIYTDGDNNIFSLDTRHGEFEVLNKKGKHQGAIDFEGKPTKTADASGKHDLDIK